ncbi:MAG: 4-(cytidine 5'-diphospho)-2-C-methyl-D-erythritol kinase [bacterium]|nr:4-(cytidine 5'-diphospho)-2-C-methyl-D-erythritol kinase [Deltaproteobacteria bacterium]MCP4906289.1 4-(cytidine 5'-diphospho)-2-C-methyl-D-erythritol kinase [bacterium]
MNPGRVSERGGRQRVRAPAKINFGLRLTGLRGDGYHLLESLFVPIDLHDEVEIEWTPGPDEIDLEMLENPASDLPVALRGVAGGAENLVCRAAETFRRATGLRGRIRLVLRKAIPVGAGLGGGSSDAAAVLAALSALVGEGRPPRAVLAKLALTLGADVPFFLAPAPALVSGIGEIIEPIRGVPEFDLVIANPGISVATAEVYRVADALADSLTEPRAGSTMRAISRLRSETGDWVSALGELLVNDLKPAANRLCPPIGRLMGRLQELGSVGVSMSGSGATVFGVFESAEEAEKAVQELRSAPNSEDSWVRVTRTLSSDEAVVSQSESLSFLGA